MRMLLYTFGLLAFITIVASPANGQTLCMNCQESFNPKTGEYKHFFVYDPGNNSSAGQGEGLAGATICRSCEAGEGSGDHSSCHANLVDDSCSSHANCGAAAIAKVAEVATKLGSMIKQFEGEKLPRSAKVALASLVSESPASFQLDIQSATLRIVDCTGHEWAQWSAGQELRKVLRAELIGRAVTPHRKTE